ncbi:O-antigen ligase family protein [Kallotenue papyrolyticum]|uniref:O-antigen ligase family protein n=1 Tax=Kallotenue papyrolyticum TaxID=1325125 RepID=UPI0004B6D96E|nr:O-antigen ligase family protein [Kallotenue papyrolyticum]
MSHTALRSLLARAGAGLLLLGGALLVFAATIWWDNAANRGIAPPPAMPLPYTELRGAVNTYNLHAEPVFDAQGNELPDNNVKRTFAMIAAANLQLVRVQFPWEDIEVCGKGNFIDCRPASAGTNTWAKYDYIVAQAQRHGLELLVRLDTPPDWARQQAINSPEIQAARAAGRFPLTGPPDDFNDFGDFVAAVAARYRDRVRFFQIWNEPNLPGEWNYREQNPAELVALLRLARERIKAVHPHAVIVFPALSPTDGLGDGVNDLEYLQGVYDAGGADTFDIMAAQLYGLGQPPAEHRYVRPNLALDRPRETLLRPIETRTDVGRVVLLREIMERNDDGHKPIWVSELGWNSAPASIPEPRRSTWGPPVSEEVKAQYLIDAITRARREWPWMGPMFVWMFRFGGPAPAPDDPTPYFALVDRDFRPLPAYYALRDYFADPPPVTPARRNPLAAAAPVLGMALVIGAGAWGIPVLVALLARLLNTGSGRIARRRSARQVDVARLRQHPARMLLLMVAALALFYWGSAQLPITALGGALFFGLALLRPDLALLLVPATVPLYLAPKGIWDARFGIRPEGIRFPLHEFVLLCAAAATLAHVLRTEPWRVALRRCLPGSAWLPPIALFALAGTLGALVADGRGAALREWRWLIVEPLLFYALARYWMHQTAQQRLLTHAWLMTGVAVAVIGLLQLVGLDLTALLPQNACFSERVVLAEGGLQRISSVYCHPNNLGLAMDRVWPVLAALALWSAWRAKGATQRPETAETGRSGARQPGSAGRGTSIARAISRLRQPYAGGALICLAALGAAFSKGALLGAAVALLVLGRGLWREWRGAAGLLLGIAITGALSMLLLGLLVGIERLNPLGDTAGARLELWHAALRMITDYPLTGPGLDQFYHLRTTPQYGQRYIDPAALTTTDRFAAHPHNLVLDLLVRVGPLGLLAMLWLLWRFIATCRRVWQHEGLRSRSGALALGLLAATSAALTHGLVDNFYFVPDLAFAFWLMLALAETLERKPGNTQTTS